MPLNPTSMAIIGKDSFVVASTTGQDTAYGYRAGDFIYGLDSDIIAGIATINGVNQRIAVWVKNTSGGTLACGQALNWVSGFWGTQVQPCPAGSPIRCFVPPVINGSASNTIPNNAWFYAVKVGQTSVLTDGSIVSINDGLVVGAVSGDVKTNYGNGLLYSSSAASTAITNTNVATAFSLSYTLPKNSVAVGDNIRIRGSGVVTAHNASDTLTLQLLVGATVIATTGAVNNAANDQFFFDFNLQMRTIGASGTYIPDGFIVDGVPGTATLKQSTTAQASQSIDTTATQLISVVATWSATSASDSVRLDELTVSKTGATSPTVSSMATAIAAGAAGSPVLIRASVNCQW